MTRVARLPTLPAATAAAGDIGREQTRRLMQRAGLPGAQTGKPLFTTLANPATAVPVDLAVGG